MSGNYTQRTVYDPEAEDRIMGDDLAEVDAGSQEDQPSTDAYNFDIESASLIMTPGCNMDCDHCMVDGGISSPHTMSSEDYRSFISELSAYDPASISVTGGGEPMLPATYEQSLELLEMIDEESDAEACIVSNIYWATDPEKARTGMENLAEAGADFIAPSWDLFHAEFYDTEVSEPLANVISASKEIEDIRVQPKIAYHSSNNLQTYRALQRVAEKVDGEIKLDSDGDLSYIHIPDAEGSVRNRSVQIETHRAYRDGNAKEQIDISEFDMHQGSELLGAQCPITEEEEAVFTIMPDGTMLPCCNGPPMREPEAFSLGTYPEDGIEDALRNASEDPVVSAITGGTMRDAVEAAAHQGLEDEDIDELMQKEYNTVCNLCDDLVTAASDKE